MPSANEHILSLPLSQAFMQYANTSETETNRGADCDGMMTTMVMEAAGTVHNMNAIQVDTFSSYLCIHIWAQNTFNLTNNDSQWQISEASRSARCASSFVHAASTAMRNKWKSKNTFMRQNRNSIWNE